MAQESMFLQWKEPIKVIFVVKSKQMQYYVLSMLLSGLRVLFTYFSSHDFFISSSVSKKVQALVISSYILYICTVCLYWLQQCHSKFLSTQNLQILPYSDGKFTDRCSQAETTMIRVCPYNLIKHTPTDIQKESL